MRSRKAGLRSRPTAATPPPAQPATSFEEPDEAAFDTQREPLPALETSGFQQFGSVMGGVIAGIEQQVFGRRPPGEVEVRQSQPTRGLTGDGNQVTLDFPDGGWGAGDGGGDGGGD
jgi:hypothetical protein